VLYASIGSGHKKAAEAIVATLLREGEHHDVILVDVLSLMNPLYRIIVPRGYLWLAKNTPSVLGFLYRISDHPFSIFPPVMFFRSMISRLFSRGFGRFMRESSPNIIVCTHFLPMELMHLDLMGEEPPLLFVAVTDIIPHAFWIAPGVERYFVASGESLKKMKQMGVSEEKISVSGIPVHPSFRREALSECSDRPVEGPLKILVVGGGAGVSPIERLLEALADSENLISVTVVTGFNRALFRRIFSKRFSYPFPLLVRGLTRRMSRLMAEADLVMTKPGGLTTAECLASGKPMILFSPIPGQEEDNRNVLEEWGVARCLSHIDRASILLKSLIRNRQDLYAMEGRSRDRGRPDASSAVCQEILLFLHERRGKDGGTSFPVKFSSAGRVAFSKWF